MGKLTFTGTAKKLKSKYSECYEDVGVWTDGCGFFSDNERLCAFNLVPGRKYRVTIETIQDDSLSYGDE